MFGMKEEHDERETTSTITVMDEGIIKDTALIQIKEEEQTILDAESINIIQPTSTDTATEEELLSQIYWAIAVQRGFKYEEAEDTTTTNGIGLTIMPWERKGSVSYLHTHMEDISHPEANSAADLQPPQIHKINKSLFSIWALADGHGGKDAAQWFIAEMTRKVHDIVHSRDWCFKAQEDKTMFTAAVQKMFQQLDHIYCEQKINEYKAYHAKIERLDARAKKAIKKPIDDGCTMVINMHYQDQFININLGDSRTIVGKRRSPWEGDQEKGSRDYHKWELFFSSVDHSPSNPTRAYRVHANGGLFTDVTGAAINGSTILHPTLHPASYQHLARCRIRRPPNFVTTQVPIRLKSTLNLSATLGDLNFKLDPPLFDPTPEITFMTFDPDYEYIFMMASDGVWDHLSCSSSPSHQAKAVLEYFAAEINYMEFNFDFELKMRTYYAKYSSQYHHLMKRLAEGLCNRQKNPNLFTSNAARFDDVTAMIGMIVTPQV